MMHHFRNVPYIWLLIISLLSAFVYHVSSGLVCLSNPCIHGVCVDENDSQYSCYCIDGYTGVQCQTNWDECWSNPCQNGGICIDGIASFNCTCPPGFVGELCEENFDECESNPCQNNGTCIDAMNGYICNCLPGYLGSHCQTDIAVCNTTAETRCANGGECVEGPGMMFTCKCPKGWGGFLCDVELNECMSTPCQNGGICVDLHADYLCACRFGYTGKNCEEKVVFCLKNPCKNDALCLMEENHPVCYCVPDYHGEKCELQYDECQLGPRCLNGGTCIDGIDSFSCSCPPNLTGLFCECLIISEQEVNCSYTSIQTTLIPTSTSALSTLITITDLQELTKQEEITTESSTYVPTSSSTFFETPSTISSISSTDATSSSTTPTVTLQPPTSSSETWTSSSEEKPITTESYFNESLTETTTEIFSTYTIKEGTISTIITTTSEGDSTSTQFPANETETSSISTSLVSNISTEYTEEISTIPTLSFTTEIETSSEGSSIDEDSLLSSSTDVPTSSVQIYNTSTYTSKVSSIFYTTDFPEFQTSETSTATVLFTETPSIKPETSTFSILTDFTTLLPENTTTLYPDCSLEESICQNGGTCMYGAEGHKCICPFNTEGKFCEKPIDISNAAFGGNSFLVHRVPNATSVEVQFKAKTVAENGLLFYSTIDGTYMCLYIEKGFLKFKFSCGYQTMLLSELKNPINNGFDTIIYSKLEFNSEFTSCHSIVKVNNTLTMTGDQIAMVSKNSKPTSWLYLGGATEEYSGAILPSTGFVGCISGLKISGKKVNIFKDAQDGYQISECSSLVCLSNPCKNGGTCISTRQSWTCLCANGFLGSTCEKSICDNNPCLFGGTCLTFTGSGYICLCPFGKHGQFCENDLQITEPYFSPTVNGYSSYSAYPIPPGAVLNSMELKFKISPTTMDQISILMFIGQIGNHDVASDHMAVSFVQGFIMLTWNLGAGPRRIFTSRAVEKGKSEYLIKLGRVGRRAWLAVEGLGNVTGRSKGKLVQLDIVPMLYLGGHDSVYFSTLPHDLPLHSGFSGCIFDVELKAGSVVIPLQSSRHAVGRAIGQCGILECHEKSCQNGGICLHHSSTFSCLCQDGWFGPLCSLRYNPCEDVRNNCSIGSICVPTHEGYECDCPFGKIGKYCEKSSSFTDITFLGKRSYLFLSAVELIPEKFQFSFELRPLSDVGLILYIANNGKSYFSLSIQSGFLELRTLPANRVHSTQEVYILQSRMFLAVGIWYKVKIGKYGRKLYITIENTTNVILLDKGDYLKLSADSVFLGGLPNMADIPYTAVPKLPIPYTGCLRLLKIDNKPIILNSTNIKSSRNIDDCDGTPCGGDYCYNEGSCWLDSNLRPHCTCKNFHSGPRCEISPSCRENTCRNGGKCFNYRCTCNMGYTGTFCETAIRVETPEFMGDGYIIVKKVDKKRDLGKIGVKHLLINFTTADKNGLIFWGSKDENFIGIGVEGGHLKLAFTVKNGNKTVIEIPEIDPISDGIWHTIEIIFNRTNVLIKMDDTFILLQSKSNSVADLFESSDGVFYLGGLPKSKSKSFWQKTHSMFHKQFKGCIRTFAINNILAMTDFSNNEGANIGNCNII